MKTLTDSALTINKIGRKLVFFQKFFNNVINLGCTYPDPNTISAYQLTHNSLRV